MECQNLNEFLPKMTKSFWQGRIELFFATNKTAGWGSSHADMAKLGAGCESISNGFKIVISYSAS